MKGTAAKKGVDAVRAQMARQREGTRGVTELSSVSREEESASAHAVLLQFREVDPNRVVAVPLSKVIDNPYNARHVYRQDRIDEMVQSIRAKGQMSPAHGFQLEDRPGYWQLVDGQFRKKALALSGAVSINLIPVEPCSDFDLYQLSFLLNHERTEQTAYDNALSWKRLLAEGKVTGQDELASRLAVSKGTVSKTLSMLELPAEVLDLVKEHAGDFGPAMCYEMALYSKLPGRTADDAVALFWEIVDKSLTTRQVEAKRKQDENSSGPRVREHSTTYPLKLGEGTRGALKVWSNQGRLSLDVRHMPEKQLSVLREELLRLLNPAA